MDAFHNIPPVYLFILMMQENQSAAFQASFFSAFWLYLGLWRFLLT